MATLRKAKRRVKREVKKAERRVKRQVRKLAQSAAKEEQLLKQKAQAHLNDAKKRFTTAEKHVKRYIHTNPEKAALIAAGVGAAIGAAIAMALRKK